MNWQAGSERHGLSKNLSTLGFDSTLKLSNYFHAGAIINMLAFVEKLNALVSQSISHIVGKRTVAVRAVITSSTRRFHRFLGQVMQLGSTKTSTTRCSTTLWRREERSQFHSLIRSLPPRKAHRGAKSTSRSMSIVSVNPTIVLVRGNQLMWDGVIPFTFSCAPPTDRNFSRQPGDPSRYKHIPTFII